MLCAAAVTAQFVAGKATRDALFLTSHDIGALPVMLMATALVSIVLVSLHARAGRLLAPRVLVPSSFVASGILFFLEWLLRTSAPSAVAVLVYLHVSVAGPLLASGFWLIVSELYSPRTAKKGIGRIAGLGTLGGVAGALIAERTATTLGMPAMLLVLGVLQIATAALVYRLARSMPGSGSRESMAAPHPLPVSSGLRQVAETPYLRRMALLVLLSTSSAVIVDYVFKAAAVGALGPGDGLLRFFSLYYGLTGLAAFGFQVLASRRVLERFGIAGATSAPSIALAGGLVAGLLFPGFGTFVAVRAGEAIFRGSWFRAGYELFFAPLPAAEKRATKSLIDVTFDRLGDALGGALIPLVVALAPAVHRPVLLALAMAASLAAIVAASTLSKWYITTLEKNLLNRGIDADLHEAVDPATLAILADVRTRDAAPETVTPAARTATALPPEPLLQEIALLRSSDHRRIVRLLLRQVGLPGELVPHVIPLLAVDALADSALFALRKVAEDHAGQMADALLNPAQPLPIRRRLARVFSVCVSQRAADALLAALDDERFDVRFQVARSLSAMVARNPALRIPPARIAQVVLNEVAVGRPVWEGRRLLDGFVSASPLDEFVRDRAGQSLAHVFTLLSLVYPREPLQIAFRSLHGDDPYLRGTALEYLEGILPAEVREPLWPFLIRSRTAPAADHQQERVVELLRASKSVTLQGVASEWDRRPIAGLSGA